MIVGLSVSVCRRRYLKSEGAVFKRYGAERSGKRPLFKRSGVGVKKLNESEPLLYVERHLADKIIHNYGW